MINIIGSGWLESRFLIDSGLNGIETFSSFLKPSFSHSIFVIELMNSIRT